MGFESRLGSLDGDRHACDAASHDEDASLDDGLGSFFAHTPYSSGRCPVEGLAARTTATGAQVARCGSIGNRPRGAEARGAGAKGDVVPINRSARFMHDA